MVNARLEVPPPGFTPLPFGLFSAIDFRVDSDPHWRLGVDYEPLCSTSGAVTGLTYEGCFSVTGTGGPPPPPPTKGSTGDKTFRGATAFSPYSLIDCSAPGFWDEAEENALRLIGRTEQRQVERAFWTGVAGLQPVVYPHLAANTALVEGMVTLQTAAVTVTGGVVDVVEGIGLLEERLATCYDGVGVIHVPMSVTPPLAEAMQLRQIGGKLFTWNGNQVVAGSGYPGTAPDGTTPPNGTRWIYATGALFGYRSAVKLIGTNGEILTRSNNTVTAIAERTYVIGWECCHFAIPVSIGGLGAGAPGVPG